MTKGRHAINKSYIHYYKIQPDGTKRYLYSVPNKQVRGKYAVHEEREPTVRVRLRRLINENKV